MKFMVCYNGSESSKKALQLAKDRASVFGAKVVLVTSMVRGTENQYQQIMDFERYLEIEKSNCELEGISVETHLLIRGLPAGEDLVEFAMENDIDEIFIGVKRHTRIGELFFGSTEQYVVQKAHCPVVTVNHLLEENKILKAA